MVHEADAENLSARLRDESQNPQGLISTFRLRHVRTGRISHVWEYRRALRAAGKAPSPPAFEGVWLDITRQRVAEHRLLNMSWKESLGTLTMGMAHDFCNLMTGIVGLSETFESRTDLDPNVRSGLGLIRKTALQASEMAHRLRGLHQGSPGESTYQDLNEIVARLLEILEKVLPRSIRVQTSLASGQLPVFTDFFEIQQVITNLALNAAHAMPAGGELTFRTARVDRIPPALHVEGTPPAPPLIGLSLQDTGTGIPEPMLSSIFEPFFTTKPLGRGSGLGLYNARLFAEKHHAAISVDTKTGVGTTFHLWFPEADLNQNRPQMAEGAVPRRTLLLFGPAGDLLDRTVEMLRQNNFYVVPVTAEAEAIEALRAPCFQLTAAILLGAPGQPELLPVCQRFRAGNLNLKIVLGAIGGSQDALPHAHKHFDAVLPLELSAADFLGALRKLLDGVTPARP